MPVTLDVSSMADHGTFRSKGIHDQPMTPLHAIDKANGNGDLHIAPDVQFMLGAQASVAAILCAVPADRSPDALDLTWPVSRDNE